MYVNRLILLFVVGTFILSPVILQGGNELSRTWLTPFGIWLLLIVMAYWISREPDHDAH